MTVTQQPIRLLLEREELPLFQNRTYATPEAARSCETGSVRLVQNLETGLIHNAAFDASRVIYDNDYNNEQGFSPAFQHHLAAVTEIVRRRLGWRNLVEVGCGKGRFLEMLQQQGADISGFDPAYEGTNPRIRREYFSPQSLVRGDGLIMRHVLEHIPDPVSFLDSLAEANGRQGLIYIEVPCFDWILAKSAWFDVFYEHVNYFRISDFERMFATVVESGRCFGGQYLYVVADLATLRAPRCGAEDVVDAVHLDVAPPAPLAAGRKAAIWGAASKGVIFAIACVRQGLPLDCAVDINPAKQGRYLPVSGLPILAPELARTRLPPGSLVYVMNSNYMDEIREITNNVYEYASIESVV